MHARSAAMKFKINVDYLHESKLACKINCHTNRHARQTTFDAVAAEK